VTDVIAFLHDRVQEPAVLLGWSLGGIVASLVAADAPERVRALVLADPPLAVLTDDDSSLYSNRNENRSFVRAVLS
jgi:pimeloyl-ACP methyl ester carboxylesterase